MTEISGLPPYDDGNIFARILRGEIPAKIIHEDDYALAFYDVSPQAPVHALVIPKGRYVSAADFSACATDEDIAGFHRAVALVAKQLGLETNGYRLISNMGPHGHQQVPHYHVHILAGQALGAMLVK